MQNYFADDAAANVAGRFADVDTARRAVDMALPLIEAAMQHQYVGESGFLHIVVMNPCLTPHSSRFEDSILFEHSVGDRSLSNADYAGSARAKAQLHWRTGIDTHLLQSTCPHLLQQGDTHLWGSAAIDGIVVGVSGANPWYDEAFAGIVACCVKAIAKDRAQQAMSIS